MGDLGNLFLGIAALITSLVGVAGFVRTALRGSDRESRRAADEALTEVTEPTKKRDADD